MKMILSIGLMCVGWLIWQGAAASVFQENRPFRVEGHVNHYFVGEEPAQWMLGHRFTMWVSNYCWRVAARAVHPPNLVALEQSMEAGYDGREVRLYVRGKEGLRNNDTTQASGFARRYSGQQMPHILDASFFDVLWLALASGRYLSGVNSNQVEPILNSFLFSTVEYYEAPFFCAARWTLHSEPPYVPLSYFQIDIGTSINPRGPHTHGKTISAFEPYTNAIYRVVRLTNWSGFVVPTMAELTTYLRFRTVIAPVHRYTIEVDRLEMTETELEFTPRLTGMTVIADHRFYQTARTVRLSAEDWPDDATVTNSASFRKQERHLRDMRKRIDVDPRRTWLARGVLIVLLAAAPITIAWQRLRKTRKTLLISENSR